MTPTDEMAERLIKEIQDEIQEQNQDIFEEEPAEKTEVPEKNMTFLEKLNQFRKEVLACDWTYDKYLSLGGNKGYMFMSSDKCRRNVAPILAKLGLEFVPEFSNLQALPPAGSLSQHWSIQLRATLIDTATGESMTSVVYGEGADSADKGIAKAQTHAVKQWLLQSQLLTDGVNADDDESVNSNTGTFRKKTSEEIEEVKSKVMEHGIPPKAEPATPKKPVPKKEEPKVEEKKEEPKEEKSELAQKVEETQVKKPEGMIDLPEGLTPIHKAALTKIYEDYQKGAENGAISAEEYNDMTSAMAEIKSSADAANFVMKYKRK